MTFGSLFAGIGGFDCGLKRAGLECAFQVEKDTACLSVLAHHYPHTPRFADVKDFNRGSIAVRPDWIVGGFPCQDLSVAGRRAGLAGKRSGLFGEFARIVDEFRPRGVLVENVPGLLSSNGGQDMATVVGALGELGYGWAYRMLDAQWFGLAQRRKRVFIVGCLGSTRRAAEILFERESLPWDSSPSREEGKRVAAGLTSGTATGSGVNRPGRRREDDTNIVSSVTSKWAKGSGGPSGDECQNLVASCLRSNVHNNSDPTMEAQMLVAHTLKAEGHDASEDGTGRGVPIVTIQECDGRQSKNQNGSGLGISEGPMYTLQAGHEHGVGIGRTVRRLMPVECCRLQGFPDDWLDLEPPLSDSAKYRMLGNAIAVPVAEWIGRRISAFRAAQVTA